jgi:hypothetical protein
MDYMVSARAHAQTVRKTADTLDVPLPAQYLKQIEQAQAFADTAAQIGASAEELNAAVLTALERGEDYHTDEIQRMLLDRMLASQNVDATARDRSNHRLATALADHADGILEDWARALDPHSAALTAAAEAVPDLNLDNGGDAVAHGGDVLTHWANAQTDVKAWTAAFDGFGALSAVAGISYSQQTMPLIYTPADAIKLAPAYETAREEHTTDLNAWTLARHRIPLRLATIGEFMERVARYEAQRQAAQLEYAKQRERHGFDGR